MEQTNKDLDLVIFGATGFTGRFVVEEVCRTASEISKLKWGIAGRSEQKLQEVTNIISVASGNTVRQPEIIIADVEKPGTLVNMAQRAKVVIACVGPFHLFGEPVVKACVENGANYVDISGETDFIERIQLNYDQKAKSENLSLVIACGFDSVPADLGIFYTKLQLESRGAIPSQIEMFTSIHCGKAGLGINYGTFASAMHGFGNIEKLRELRKSINRPKVPKIGPPLKIVRSFKWDERVNGYIYPSILTDPSVIRLGQVLDIENQTGVPPAQIAAYLVFPKLRHLVMSFISASVCSFLVKFSWGKSLLLKHPKFFTFGVFSHNGPTLEQIQQTSFTHKFFAKGIPKTDNQASESSTSVDMLLPKDLEIVTEVTGPEPGYVATPICVVQCAYTILKEEKNVAKGVLTPSTAFHKTSLIKKLMENGINFK